MNLPKRKSIRLKEFNYSQSGAYFITICTQNRKNLFWEKCYTNIDNIQEIKLSTYGIIVNDSIKKIAKKYSFVNIEKYVIMPNHVHLLLQINFDDNGQAMPAPTVSNIIGQFKGYVTKQIGFKVWQKLFYDHIVRNENDYNEIWTYIENNPYNWLNDKLYADDQCSAPTDKQKNAF